jgi:hypothetical protein
MLVTVNDVLSQVASRMGFNAIPTNLNEKNRWIAHCSDAQRSIIRKNFYWFTQDTKSLTTIVDTERYQLDDTFRQMIDVRINGVPVNPITQHQQAVSYNSYYTGIRPVTNSYGSSYYIYGEKELRIIPPTKSVPEILTVTSITRSGSLVTVTTDDEHGYSVDDFITIAGAVETDYNGAIRVYSVPTSTTFTYVITSTPTTPATGTITAQRRNIVYNFYKLPTRVTALNETLLIPELFMEGFVSYVKARLDLRDSQRGSAGDGFDEFNELIQDLDVENNKRMLSNTNIFSY